MPRFRCMGRYCADSADTLGFDFTASGRMCPRCQSTDTNMVVDLVQMHFLVGANRDWMRENKRFTPFIACGLPNLAGKHGTGDPKVVTCEACKSTEVYKQHMEMQPESAVAAPPQVTG